MPQSVFRLFDPDSFHNYLRQTTFQRKVTMVQNHHTFKPGYAEWNRRPDHLFHLEGMRRFHIHDRGWADIGQNLTIFPDGTIALCRPIDSTPAGIFGANTGGLCIESIGDFDEGRDVMTEAQREAILKATAALCLKFGLKPLPHQLVYHHWYSTGGKRFLTPDIDSGKVRTRQLQKSCPGTAFFCTPGSAKGNTVACAIANFYPPVQAAMNALGQTAPPPLQPVSKRVTATTLRVRAGQGTGFPVVRSLPRGQQVQVFDTQGKWARISANAEEWVSTDFIA